MIFCGDTIFTGNFSKDLLDNCNIEFAAKPKIVNLESLIKLEENMEKISPGIGLLSSIDTLEFLKALHIKACILANNHVTDFDISISKLINILAERGIGSCGAGEDLKRASAPYFFEHQGKKIGVLAFGWKTISCIYATQNTKGVNPLKYDHVINSVANFFSNHPGTDLVTVFHWNYEYERFPQPAHRKLAFELIDMGVNAVLGHHPHIVQGAETYKGKPIFYSLGNFYFPAGIHSGFNVQPPNEAYSGLCVEYGQDAKNTTLYWTRLQKDGKLTVESKETLKQSERIKYLTPFEGMEHEEYIRWFKANRCKKKMLPIYKNPTSRLETSINDRWVKIRQSLIDFIVRCKSFNS